MDKQDVKVKMCGMMRAEDILAANELAPDFVGCILAKGFRRTVSEEDAARFRSSLLPSIPLVGVFVNDTPKRAAELLNDGVINIAQLHGDGFHADITRQAPKFGFPAHRVEGMLEHAMEHRMQVRSRNLVWIAPIQAQHAPSIGIQGNAIARQQPTDLALTRSACRKPAGSAQARAASMKPVGATVA